MARLLFSFYALLMTATVYAGVGDSIGVGVMLTVFLIYTAVFLVIGSIIVIFVFKSSKGNGYTSIFILILLYILSPLLLAFV